ncbi:hypothetical protein N7510_009473 [Penicillium lagena]|uniref:uncharacterized protein n=1 Tax=Penicillium lagena TaxID=94218 RepID=UPI00254260F3|nr:uncharacterized protein N7510_009473 [Penicillium lagena]KAJ5606692.1 hypothetical protein N7510_009473 [Penicillium lagena]
MGLISGEADFNVCLGKVLLALRRMYLLVTINILCLVTAPTVMGNRLNAKSPPRNYVTGADGEPIRQ